MKDDASELKSLGSKETKYPLEKPSSSILETFPNRFPGRLYTVEMEFPEWTSLCPRTGQPDFGKITVIYIPKKRCIESKSLKLYFFSWRGEGVFMETITNRILDDIWEACGPRFCKVIGEFNARGGITITVFSARHEDD